MMLNRIPILDCVPNKEIKLRPQQVNALLWIEANYDRYKYLFLDMPVGAGKSWVVTTYNNWVEQNSLGRTADITPTKLLQDQYTKDFDWIPDLKGQNAYPCKLLQGGGSCADYKRYSPTGKLCHDAANGNNCCYMVARKAAESSRTAIFNFHSYFYNKMWENKDHMVIDEGHNSKAFLEGMFTIDLWSCELDFDANYPSDPKSIQDLVGAAYARVSQEWTEAVAKKLDNIIEELEEMMLRLESVSLGLKEFGADILVVKKEEDYKKRKWMRKDMSAFKDTKQTLFRIKPLKIAKIAHNILWKDKIKKVLVLSATLDQADAQELGIPPEQVAFFKSDSPIPAAQRKFIAWPVANMSSNYQKESLPIMVEKIKEIASKFPDKKGVIHCTYSISRMLRQHLFEQRYVYHDEKNKNDVYYRFRESKEPQILIACGMSEGIDLAYDLARFQIIMKVQYPSLGDDVWRWKSANNKRAYSWETIKTILQQSGRICRAPDDRGFTYMLDSEFKKLWDRTKETNMWPQWFRDAMVWVGVKND